jgi:hypothetical protein
MLYLARFIDFLPYKSLVSLTVISREIHILSTIQILGESHYVISREIHILSTIQILGESQHSTYIQSMLYLARFISFLPYKSLASLTIVKFWWVFWGGGGGGRVEGHETKKTKINITNHECLWIMNMKWHYWSKIIFFSLLISLLTKSSEHQLQLSVNSN